MRKDDILDQKLRKFERKMTKVWLKHINAFETEATEEFEKQKLPGLFEKLGEDADNYLQDATEGIRAGDCL